MKNTWNHLPLQKLRGMRASALLLPLLVVATLVSATPLVADDQVGTVRAESVPSVEQTKPIKNTIKKTVSTKPRKTAPASSQVSSTNTTSRTASVTKAVVPVPTYDTVSIPSIGFSSRFVTVGLTDAGAVDVHPSLVGWWNGSAQPGRSGAVFLDGHNPGVFSSLPNIKVGADITVKLASGKHYTYKVVYRETVRLVDVDMVKALTPYGGADQGLNLMTCMGTYNPATGTTDKRLVVYATR